MMTARNHGHATRADDRSACGGAGSSRSRVGLCDGHLLRRTVAKPTSEDEVLTTVKQFADQVEMPGVHAGLDDDVD
jgi:hypothetical protein